MINRLKRYVMILLGIISIMTYVLIVPNKVNATTGAYEQVQTDSTIEAVINYANNTYPNWNGNDRSYVISKDMSAYGPGYQQDPCVNQYCTIQLMSVPKIDNINNQVSWNGITLTHSGMQFNLNDTTRIRFSLGIPRTGNDFIDIIKTGNGSIQDNSLQYNSYDPGNPDGLGVSDSSMTGIYDSNNIYDTTGYGIPALDRTPPVPSDAYINMDMTHPTSSTTKWEWQGYNDTEGTLGCLVGTMNYRYKYTITPIGYDSGWIANTSGEATFTTSTISLEYTVEAQARCTLDDVSSEWSSDAWQMATYRGRHEITPNVEGSLNKLHMEYKTIPVAKSLNYVDFDVEYELMDDTMTTTIFKWKFEGENHTFVYDFAEAGQYVLFVTYSLKSSFTGNSTDYQFNDRQIVLNVDGLNNIVLDNSGTTDETLSGAPLVIKECKFLQEFPYLNFSGCINEIGNMINLFKQDKIQIGGQFTQGQIECRTLNVFDDWLNLPDNYQVCAMMPEQVRDIVTPFITFGLALIAISFLGNKAKEDTN